MSAKFTPEYATSIATSSSAGARGAKSETWSVEAEPNFSIAMCWWLCPYELRVVPPQHDGAR